MSTANFVQNVQALQQQIPENKLCSDCLSEKSEWASSNLGVFFCINCSGVHRNMGTHISKVRSLTLDDWSESQYNTMKELGNKKANEYWECNLFPFEKPLEFDVTDYRKKFIENKYVHKKYVPSGSSNIMERNFEYTCTNKSGWVTKQGGSVKTWKKRWMVLSGATLSYYVHPNDSVPKGTLTMTETTKILFADEMVVGKPNCFAVHTDKRVYHIITESEELFSWVYHLRASVYFKHLFTVFSSCPGRFPIKPNVPQEKRGPFKRIGKMGTKKCFLVLKGDSLLVYNKEGDSKAHLTFPIKQTEITRDENGFILTYNGKRSFFIGTENDWFTAIQNSCRSQCDYYRVENNSKGLHQYVLDMISNGKQTPRQHHSPFEWSRASFCKPQQPLIIQNSDT